MSKVEKKLRECVYVGSSVTLIETGWDNEGTVSHWKKTTFESNTKIKSQVSGRIGYLE